MTREASGMPAPEDKVGNDAFLRQAGRNFLLAMYTGLRSLKLYPVENATAQKALDELQAAALALLTQLGEIELRLSGDFIFVKGTGPGSGSSSTTTPRSPTCWPPCAPWTWAR